MLRFVQAIGLSVILSAGTIHYGQNVVASERVPILFVTAMANFQPVNNQVSKADPRRYSAPAAIYQSHARDYTQMLYYHANSDAGLKPAQAQHYVGEIKKNLELSTKAFNGLQAAHPNDTHVKTAITTIEQHHAKVVEHCDMINGECQKSKTDNMIICDCCADIDHELQAAQKETDALMKHLKLEKLPTPRKSTEKATTK